jgi:hypothetical protein
MRWTNALVLALTLSSFACTDDGNSDAADAGESSGDGDGDMGDGDQGDGDGDQSGDGDGDGDGESGDGDGDSGDGDGDGESGDGDGDGESGDGDGDGESGDGDGEGDPIMCPGVFPTFDKSCSGVAECAIAIHTTDCCGNSVALGINVAETEAFAAAEAICDMQYPACGCPSGPTMAEDGQPVLDPMGLAVDCLEGLCTTFVQ